MDLFVFGLNHKTAPVEVRERWAFSRDESVHALRTMCSRVAASEHLILSTCNRTEFYGHVPRAHSPLTRATDSLAQRSALARYYRAARTTPVAGEDDPSFFYLHRQEKAVKHLFRLAGGLNSMIVGESEILHQIKDAFNVAQKAKATGKMFHRLFPEALRVGKRVRTQTGISDGCITPGQAALKIGRSILGDLGSHAALVIGSGKIATLTARAFCEAGMGCFTVVNRTQDKATELLESLRAEHQEDKPVGLVRDWSARGECMVAANLIISSTGSSEPLFDQRWMEQVQRRRDFAPLVVIDLAIPRDFHPDVEGVPGVRLFNIDHLNGVIQDNIAERHAHIPAAESIVSEQTRVFAGQMAYKMQVDPVIRHLIERFEDMRLGHLQTAIDKFPPEWHDALDEMTRGLVKKLLHFPIERLKSLRDMEGLDETQTAFLRRLFLADR